MHGWIVLDKPSGITSAHAVAKVKRILSSLPSPLEGEGGVGGNLPRLSASIDTPHLNPPPQGGRKNNIKIGHAGTLDPLASGVLPLALGEATKTVSYMMDAAKAYAFTVTWGQETDTDDSQGQVVKTSDKRPISEEIIALLPEFTGKIQQLPPDYSAIKVDGVRAYDAARSGEALTLKPREVIVNSLEYLGEGRFICHCGKGTYIRSLARDMGRKIGCLGHISRLRRIKVGKFTENDAISLEKLEEMVHKDGLGFLKPVEAALDDILARDIDQNQAAQLKRGQTVILPKDEPRNTVFVRHDNKLVAICEVFEKSMKPVRVFNL